MRHLILVPLLAAAVLGCNNNNNSTSTTPDIPVTVTDTFAGTIGVNGAFVHNFSVARAGSVTAQITALSPDSTVTVGVALGTWNGSACQLIITNDTATLSTQIIGTATAPGTLCVRVSDAAGTLTAPTDYELTVSHY